MPRLTGPSEGPDPVALIRAQVAAAAALEKNGIDVVILEVGEVLGIIELFVIASATNIRQVKTIVEEVERAVAESDGDKPNAVEGLRDASWVLMDYGDVVVHVFLDETRSYYDLDRLWADVPHVDVPHLDVLVPEPQIAT
jgi:ribosome-associated protein